MAGQRSGHPSDVVEVLRGDHRRLRVTDLPQLCEGELEDREAALDPGADQFVDQGRRLVASVHRLGRADHRLANARRRERAQQMDRPRQLVADVGQLGGTGEKVATNGC